jgi:hypothetical protein
MLLVIFGTLRGYDGGSFGNIVTYSIGIGSRSYIVTIGIGNLNYDRRLNFAIANSGTNNIYFYSMDMKMGLLEMIHSIN